MERARGKAIGPWSNCHNVSTQISSDGSERRGVGTRGPQANLRKFRKLADESGLDPNIWFGNVEHAAADIVGRETVQYVANIYKYYVAYRLATERHRERIRAKEAAAPMP
jgi:hypothetical protein